MTVLEQLVVTLPDATRVVLRGRRLAMVRWLVAADYLDRDEYEYGQLELSWAPHNLAVKATACGQQRLSGGGKP